MFVVKRMHAGFLGDIVKYSGYQMTSGLKTIYPEKDRPETLTFETFTLFLDSAYTSSVSYVKIRSSNSGFPAGVFSGYIVFKPGRKSSAYFLFTTTFC